MSINTKKIMLSVFFITLAALACNMPGGAPPTQSATEKDTATPTATFTSIAPVFSETPSPTTEACKPTVTTSVVANIRSGPGQVYNIIGSLPQGGSANVAGKSTDGTWWYIEFAAGTGGFAWISSTVTTPTCIPDTLASIVAPPTPIVPTAVPTEVAQEAAPSATSVPGLHLVPIGPPILIFVNSPTPVPPVKIKPPIIKVNPPIIIQP